VAVSAVSATWYMHTKVSLLDSTDTHTPTTCLHQTRKTRSSANRSLSKLTSYRKHVKMQFDHCNIAKTAELSLSLTASAYANVQSNQEVVDDS
jgi:hypothetical protein